MTPRLRRQSGSGALRRRSAQTAATNPHFDEQGLDISDVTLTHPDFQAPDEAFNLSLGVRIENWSGEERDPVIDVLTNGNDTGKSYYPATMDVGETRDTTFQIGMDAPINNDALPSSGEVEVVLKFPDAPSGTGLTAGTFTIEERTGDECTQDIDCPTGEVCESGSCVEGPDPGCQTDFDCPSWQKCRNDGECVACLADHDCDGDLVCNSNNECVEDTGGGGGGCQFDRDCPNGFVCQDGVCVEDNPSGCQSDSECPDGYKCQDGTCVEKTSDGLLTRRNAAIAGGVGLGLVAVTQLTGGGGGGGRRFSRFRRR